jgi:hypothetical protein
MIDKTNGSIYLKKYNLTLKNRMTDDILLKSEFMKILKNSSGMRGGYVWYYFNEYEYKEWILLISVCFKNDILEQISFTSIEKNESCDWSDWAFEKEMNRKNKNEELLFDVFGTKPELIDKECSVYNFEWGKIISSYDQKSGSSRIIIQYK